MSNLRNADVALSILGVKGHESQNGGGGEVSNRVKGYAWVSYMVSSAILQLYSTKCMNVRSSGIGGDWGLGV